MGRRGIKTVAHIAAERGHLPANFDQWHLTDEDGCTVAHVAAKCGHLPDNFSQWALADGKGRTVAHIVAMHGNLPENFDQWELADKQGVTIGAMAKKAGGRCAKQYLTGVIKLVLGSDETAGTEQAPML